MSNVYTDTDGRHYVLRAWKTVNGERVYAHACGKRCFKIYID